MIDLLNGLRDLHGDHPVLLESVADYLEDAAERATLYRQAANIAKANGLPTLSIRQAIARLLVDVGKSAAAIEELRVCGGELVEANEDERTRWVELLNDAAYDAVDDGERPSLYRQATDVAATHGQPTLGIRLSLVRFFLDKGNPAAAIKELRACENEIPEADEDKRVQWAELLEEAGRSMK